LRFRLVRYFFQTFFFVVIAAEVVVAIVGQVERCLEGEAVAYRIGQRKLNPGGVV
jgi:hypothetical protein